MYTETLRNTSLGRCSCNCFQTFSSLPWDSKQLLRTQKLPRHDRGCLGLAHTSFDGCEERTAMHPCPSLSWNVPPPANHHFCALIFVSTRRSWDNVLLENVKMQTRPLQNSSLFVHLFGFCPVANLFVLNCWRKMAKENKKKGSLPTREKNE